MSKKQIIFYLILVISLGALAAAAGYYFAYQKKKPVATEEANKVSTLNWQDFTNLKYGYQLKYPNRWKLDGSQTSAEVKIYFPSENEENKAAQSEGKLIDGLSITGAENTDSLSSRDWIYKNIPADKYQRSNVTDVQYNNIPGTEIKSLAGSTYSVFFAREKQIYQIDVFVKDKSAETKEILNQFSIIEKLAEIDKSYTVRQNETLSYIAGKFKISWPKLARYNKLKSPYNVYVGQKLKIPADPNALPDNSSETTIDLDVARELQSQVDAGKEVWRLDPLEVSRREIPSQKQISESDSFRIVSEDRLAGEVTVEIQRKDGLTFLAQLVQPIKKGSSGIWMVKSLKSK